MSTLIKFPSIDQFRHVIREIKNDTFFVGLDDIGGKVYDPTQQLPKVTFTGKVKLHGTNAAIVFPINDTSNMWSQSRERILNPLSDNAGFCQYVLGHTEFYTNQANTIINNIEVKDYEYLTIYGEWCGSGVQHGVAISQLPKMFVVFGVKLSKLVDNELESIWITVETSQYFENNSEVRMYHIDSFPSFTVDVDIANPEITQHIISELVLAVEQECPVGAAFGVSGVGEGIVFTGVFKDKTYVFKAKGSRHSVSKVKTVAPVDIERVNSINELVDQIVTENRLQQGLTYLTENLYDLDIKNTGVFIKWVVGDCIKEEIDTIIGSGLEVKEVSGKLSQAAKTWFFDNLPV